VISSGYDKATLQSRFSTERSIEFLSKPFTAEQLEAAIRDFEDQAITFNLDPAAAAAPAAAEPAALEVTAGGFVAAGAG
jgi:hypothetical protein